MLKHEITQALRAMEKRLDKQNENLEFAPVTNYASKVVRRQQGGWNLAVWSDAIDAALAEAGGVYFPASDEHYYVDRTIILDSGMHIKADSGATIQAIDAARFCTIRNRNIAEAKGVKFINGSYWEDICCKSGPLVNPTFFREACAPQYRRHSELLNKHGVNLLTEARLVPPAAER